MFNTVEYLKSCHTKQLLNLRRKFYKIHGWARVDTGPGFNYPDDELLFSIGESQCTMNINFAQLKTELATREHIPACAKIGERASRALCSCIAQSP